MLIEGDDILGDGVNVAARLESIAEPGGICASRHLLTIRFAARFRSSSPIWVEQRLKNIERPERVYAARAGALLVR